MARTLDYADKVALALADPGAVINSLTRFRARPCPPWLPANHPYSDGAPPTGKSAFEAASSSDLLDIIAVRGPLHAIDGWGFLGRAFSALLSGHTHTARHLAYYGELRAALSILASSGIGIFNRRNAVIDASGQRHILSDIPTHDMAWLALAQWSINSTSLERLVSPIQLAGFSLLQALREFFPSHVFSTVGGELMKEWGFDLQMGLADREQRNWSSYQPTTLGALATTPSQDAEFLKMFWKACRPNSVELERHLFRILLEREARSHNTELYEYPHQYNRLQDNVKTTVSFDFLQRIDEPVDHQFLHYLAYKATPAPAYAMMCRAAFLLKLATGIAESNFRAAGVQPVDHFEGWWQNFGVEHGLWSPEYPPTSTADLWEDIDLALDETEVAPHGHRHEWISALAGNATRICQTERVGLWGLFQ